MRCRILVLQVWAACAARGRVGGTSGAWLALRAANISLEIVEGAKGRAASPDCPMQHKFVAFTAAASRAPASAHCTVRVRDAQNHQIGDKMRTHRLGRQSTWWDEVMEVPVACPELPLDIRLEVNVRGAASFPRFSTEQIGQVFFFLDTVGLGVQSSQTGSLNIQLNSTWCRDADCVQRLVNETSPERQAIRHKGLDCGSGCHNALAALSRNIVSNARTYLGSAMVGYRRDKHNEKYDKFSSDMERPNAEQEKALLDKMEQYWDCGPADKDHGKAWEKLSRMLRMIPFIAKKACGDHQPVLPFVESYLGRTTIKNNYQTFSDLTSRYLSNMEKQLEKAATELRRLWFEEKVYALKAVDEKCPTSQSVLQEAAQP